MIRLAGFENDPRHPPYTAARVACSLGYAMMMWTLVQLTLGTFRKFCTHSRPAIRYLANSSYWMDLIHLPVVVWWQVAVTEVSIHRLPKLTFVSVATVGPALLTYDLFVRSTMFGQLLNGRRHERALRLPRPRARAG